MMKAPDTSLVLSNLQKKVLYKHITLVVYYQSMSRSNRAI